MLGEKNRDFNQMLTLVHIHMEIGSVTTVRIRDSKTKSQPQMPRL